jgi:hypothetical protein
VTPAYRHLLAGAALVSLWPVSSHAQETSVEPSGNPEAMAAVAILKNEAGERLMSAGSPPDRAMAGTAEPKFTFSSEDGDNAVSLSFSFDLNRQTPVPDNESSPENPATFYRVTQHKLSVVATAPVDEETSLSSLFAGDSLVSGTKVKLSWSRLSNTLGDGKGAGAFLNVAYQRCVSDQSGEWLRLHRNGGDAYSTYLADISASAADVVGEYKTPRGYAVALRSANRNAQNSPDSIARFVYAACAATDLEGHRFREPGALLREYAADSYAQFASRFIDDRSWFDFIGLDASVGQDDYQYLDRALFETPKAKKTSWEVAAYGGFINWNSTFAIRGRAVYGRGWKLPEDGEACEPVGDPPEEKCLTGPDGPPEKVETGLLSVETRHLLVLDDQHSIALAPQVTYRFEDDAIGVEVPVYLAPNENGELTGGLKFAYSSKGDEFGIGVFVGVPFKMAFD